MTPSVQEARHIFIDTNVFDKFSKKKHLAEFIKKIEKSDNPVAKELLEALINKKQIQEPQMFLEKFGIQQKQINQRLEAHLKNAYPKFKSLLDPFITKYKEAKKHGYEDSECYLLLADGFVDIFDEMYDECYAILDAMGELSDNDLLIYIDNKKRSTFDQSSLFIDDCQYWQNNIKVLRIVLIAHLSVEAIFRFGTNMITHNYPQRKDIKLKWCEAAGNFCLQLRNHKQNISGYRNISELLSLINRNIENKFFHTNQLRPYDDTLDSYLIHFVTFGWFGLNGELQSILAITYDPYEDVLARVQQYQGLLAYEQNAPQNNLYKRSEVLHSPKPGILYIVDDKKKEIKCLIMEPASIREKDGLLSVHYNIKEETISLKNNYFKLFFNSFSLALLSICEMVHNSYKWLKKLFLPLS